MESTLCDYEQSGGTFIVCIVWVLSDLIDRNNISKMNNPDKVMKQCLDIIVKLAEYGLIHGDFNEFNLMVSDDEKVTVIDFPQMVSTSHKNAEMWELRSDLFNTVNRLFDRDVNCIIDFFNKRFGVQSDYIPKLEGIKNEHNLDVAVEASGFTKKMEKQMEEVKYYKLYK